MAKVLNKSQATEIYNAMCYLNNVSARLCVNIDDCNVMVKEQPCGNITVYHGPIVREVYANQHAFAVAYQIV